MSATGVEDLRRLLLETWYVYSMPKDHTNAMEYVKSNRPGGQWAKLLRTELSPTPVDPTTVGRISQRLIESGATTGASDIRSGLLPVVTVHYPEVAPFPTEASHTIDEIYELRKLPPGWTGYDVAAPKFGATEAAVSWVKEMYDDVQEIGGKWHAPHVAANADGDVLFEWWNDDTDKGLAVYVSESGANYILDWGTDMEAEMEDGEATTPESRRRLWSELMR